MPRRKIAIVEDNPSDAKLLRFSLAQCDPDVETAAFEDGEEAIRYFSSAPNGTEAAPCDLILLDLNLPRVSGFEVLEYLKTSPELKKIPVIVLSGSSSQEDIDRCYALGANCYISKPTGIDEVLDTGAQIIQYWFGRAKLPRGVPQKAMWKADSAAAY